MTTYKAPDVYVEEISVFPPSVAEVETAVPAFIGYTERALLKGVEDVTLVPTEITSFLEYQATFGGAPPVKVRSVELDLNNAVTRADVENSFYMYDSLRLFFQNGGGKCYIISIGSFKDNPTPEKGDFIEGLRVLKKQDEPTIILFPDAVLLGEGIYDVQQQALMQCGELMDRVAVFDMLEAKAGDVVFGWKEGYKEFRDRIGINDLKYGAAYTPYLKTSLEKKITYRDVSGTDVLKKAGVSISLKKLTDNPDIIKGIENLEYALADNAVINGDKTKAGSIANFLDTKADKAASLKAGYYQKVLDFRTAVNAELAADKPKADKVRPAYKGIFEYTYTVVRDLVDKWGTPDAAVPLTAIDGRQTVIGDVRSYAAGPVKDAVRKMNSLNSGVKAKIGGNDDVVVDLSTLTFSAAAWGTVFTDPPEANDDVYGAAADDSRRIKNMQAGEAKLSELFEVIAGAVALMAQAAGRWVDTYEDALAATFPLFKNILAKVASSVTLVPPSGVIAGIYSFVDKTRGVWKAPANVSLASIIGVTTIIDSKAQEDLNVDVVAGKSINVIRPFTGKGVLVWGARTLAGNDNEWRYVPVRRFFNMVEESVKKSTYWAVFEPNDANTWVKVRGMIENYLIQKWREGALAGATPKEAFFVRCGIGTTMDAQDILEGRMNVEIGMAVVRPAEFIVLKFSHKLQTS